MFQASQGSLDLVKIVRKPAFAQVDHLGQDDKQSSTLRC